MRALQALAVAAEYVDAIQAAASSPPRERIELLHDPDSPCLDLSPEGRVGSDFASGPALVTGIGAVEGVECVNRRQRPTVKGGTSNPWTLKRSCAPTI
jgi:acetyl-CoA carboxylase carboxyltransferase component